MLPFFIKIEYFDIDHLRPANNNLADKFLYH